MQDHQHQPDDHQEHQHDNDDNSLWGVITSTLHIGHTHGDKRQQLLDDAAYVNELGIRTVKQALALLGITTILQIIVFLFSGSVALLADTVHNLGDALNSVPLWIAFVLARRSANRRYTYGYGRAEDLAGVIIVLSIAFSAAYILYESIRKFVDPQPIRNLIFVAAAGLIGFLGNELVAILQIRVGRKIGSEAMVTDGRHARADGLTSLAVLLAVIGTALGFPIADPLVGIVIGIAIVFITRDAIVSMWFRLMDAVDPELTSEVQAVIRNHPQVRDMVRCQMRWIGHRMQVEAVLALDADLTTGQAETIIDEVTHDLYHTVPNLAEATIAIQPWNPEGISAQRQTEHHRIRMTQTR